MFYRKFGGSFSIANGVVSGTADGFNACEIDIADYSDRSDVVTGPLISGATKTAIIASLFVKEGTIVIKNPYRKPDVTELLEFASNAGYEVGFSPAEIRICKRTEPQQMVSHSLVDDISAVMTYITIKSLL